MAASLIYKNAFIYELAMIGLYGRHYASRYRALADLIPPGSSVLDLCCGPAILYDRYLRHKSVDYLGLDINVNFIDRLTKRGVRAKVWDLRSGEPLPPADYVIMQASLYHFFPAPLPILTRMLQAAGKQVVIAEPVRNLTSARLPLLASISRLLTDPGDGSQSHRFTEQTLDDLLNNFCLSPPRGFLISGGREKIYVIDKHRRCDQ